MEGSFGNQVTSFVVNPFIQTGSLELFGTIETMSGDDGGSFDGNVTQYAGEAVYRFADDDLFIGARYNTMSGDINLGEDLGGFFAPSDWNDVSVDRWQFSAGWFMTENVLVKAGYVTQSYDDFPATRTVRLRDGTVDDNFPTALWAGAFSFGDLRGRVLWGGLHSYQEYRPGRRNRTAHRTHSPTRRSPRILRRAAALRT